MCKYVIFWCWYIDNLYGLAIWTMAPDMQTVQL